MEESERIKEFLELIETIEHEHLLTEYVKEFVNVRLIKENIVLYLTIPLKETTEFGRCEVVYTLFENKELLVSNVKNLFDVVRGIKEYINKNINNV